MRLFSISVLAMLVMSPSLSDCGLTPDADQDGYTSDVDCDDTNPAIHPGAVEACNGIDDNCSGSIDEGCPTGFALIARYSGIRVEGGTYQYGTTPEFEALEQSNDFEPFDREVSGSADYGDGWYLTASSWQTSELTPDSMRASGEAQTQLSDSSGYGGGSAVATDNFEVKFEIGHDAVVTVDVGLITDIYERTDEVSVFVELSGPDGEVFTEALVNVAHTLDQTHRVLLPAGIYWLQVEAYSSSSLSGWWDDYPGSTATWKLNLTAE